VTISLRPATRAEAREAVRDWHSHHRPHVGEVLAIGAFDGERLCGVVVWGRPSARLLSEQGAYEVTRLAVGPDAPHCTASRLLGAVWRAAKACGVRRLVSYTRVDDVGTCYRAAGWVPTAVVRGQAWTHGGKATRWLPGLYVPSSEVIDRVRWEIGPAAMPAIRLEAA
jgi:hypothetical protein